jgi:hypothetical protein
MEPTPPELGAGTGSPHELVIEGREELLYLLGEAAELEHSVCCSYLYAAFYPPGRPRRRVDGRAAAGRGGVEATINEIALQEMIHLVLVNNLLAALGGGARLGRYNLPSAPPTRPRSN